MLAHAVLTGPESSWVLLQGGAGQLQAARSRLEASGHTITRSGRWLGEAVGDAEFDWFLCCAGALDHALVGEALGTPAADEAPGGAARLPMLEQQIIELWAELAGLRQSLSKAASRPAPQPVPADHAMLNQAMQQIAALEARLALEPAIPTPSPPPRHALRIKDEFSSALTSMRPDLLLLRDSLTVVFGEYASRAAVYRTLAELPPSGGRPDGWKLLRGLDNWWERHVGTGSSDAGRCYASFNVMERKWAVLFSVKGEQDRDIAWLRRVSIS